MTKVSVIYFSGYGHTAKQANAVIEGCKLVSGVTVTSIAIDKEGNVPETAWDTLASSQAILFGAPTYMGGPAWQFKKFADTSSKSWGASLWKDKIAGGFTNSASMNGDKFSTLSYFMTLAMQHSMIWAGTGLMPANKKSSNRNDVNYLGAFAGALAQSPSDSSPEEGPPPGDLETAKLFGQRLATLASRLG